jgi:[protein-PII] uridylyltransferase
MAKNSFLAKEDHQALQNLFLKPSFWKQPRAFEVVEKSLQEKLLQKLGALENFKESRPVALGSLAREEFCLQSDIDLLCFGPEERVRAFSRQAQEEGLKIRLRFPEDLQDWTKGVEPFDVLALTQARALVPVVEDVREVQAQRDAVFFRRRHWAKEILKAIRLERKARRDRYDSVANYLQPNLKFGPGGLRDIEQVFSYLSFFQLEILLEFPDSIGLLKEHKEFLLKLRQLNHLMGLGDTLSAQSQLQMTEILGFKNLRDFASRTQQSLNEASFMADGLINLSRRTKGERRRSVLAEQTSWEELFTKLEESESWLLNVQLKFRDEELHGRRFPSRGFLKQMMSKPRPESFWLNVFRSGLLESYLPEYKAIKGLVQHDHYHKFTVDAHLIQALREVSRVQKTPKRAGKLSSVVKLLDDEDWKLLRYAALFHDLGKGRDQDHSLAGRDLVERVFTDLKIQKSVTSQVAWLVENHLILSTAAFRMNPASPKTWKLLFDRGLQGKRIPLLFVFTAIDILATNPEAWTAWKAQTLYELFENLTSSTAGEYGRFVEIAHKNHFESRLLEKMDPYLIEQIRPVRLLQDLRKAKNSKKDLAPAVVTDSKGSVWVRFHRKQDRSGLFVEFVQRLYHLGDHIQACVVMTDEEVGVYDWFCLRGRKSKDQVLKRLQSQPESLKVTPPRMFFEHIDLVSQTEEEAIISFRGKNQKGLLLLAAIGLFEEGLSIVWVRAHTWGSQVDDTFCVLLRERVVDDVLKRLRARFVT